MNIRAKIYGGADAADEPILKAKKPKGAKADELHSVSVARDIKRASNSRAEDRHRLTEERATVTHDGRDFDVELINLSGGGAMVAGTLHPMLWNRVHLHLGNHGTIECAVIWIRDDRIGLEFAHETHLDGPLDQVAIVLRHVIERTFPHIKFAPGNEPEAKAPECPQPESADDHRAAPRHPLIWTGTLHHDYQSSPIRVRNVSDSGAMIESATPVRVGAQPLLEFTESASVSVTVEWAVGNQVGVRFNEPFDLHQLADSRPTVAPQSPAKWAPPSYLKPAPKAPTEDYWKRLDLGKLRDELEGFLKR